MKNHTIESASELELLYGKPKPASLKKQAPELNEVYTRWIQQARFFVLASAGKSGLDCAPRGDASDKGFLILDNKTFIIPDRRGNNRLDTLRNIIEDPRVALLFLIPGIHETVRINGQATVSTDPALLSQFELDGTLPLSCIRIAIDAVFFQNARALSRSGLWQTESHLSYEHVPTPEKMANSNGSSL